MLECEIGQRSPARCVYTADGRSTVLAGIGLTSDPHGPFSIESGFSQLVYPKDEGQDLGSLVVALQNGGKSAKFVAEILPPCTAGKP